MKRTLHKLFTAFVLLAAVNSASAQNVYFREGFNEGEGEVASAATDAVPGRYIYQNNSGTWYTFGGYRSNGPTGSCSTATGGFSHLRLANLANAGLTAADSAYVVTPVVNFGINQLTLLNGRASRRLNIYKTTDTLATTTNWTLVEVIPNTNTACQQHIITVNDPTARRLMIMARGGTDTDIDSLVLTSTSTIVPVVFSSFNAAYANNLVKLNWNIGAELNTASYQIERSVNGREFGAIGTVEAINAGGYNWIDNNPVKGTAYYRIKAVDKDGRFMYSSVVNVNTNSRSAEVSVSPNPVKGGIVRMQLSNLDKGSYTVAIYNNNGQVVYSGSVINDGGFTTRNIQLPSNVSAGIYRLQLTNGATKIVKNIVVE